MSLTLDQLLAGIKQVESSGNYSVVNSIGAVGAYQVMKGNIPSWTKEALGYSMTWQQFRDNPSAQDAVARYMIGKYFKQYGAEGAAAMWFSGQPNPNSGASDGGNTVRSYVNKVLAAAGGSSSTSSSGGGSTTTPSIDPATLAQQYGFTAGFLNANPELKKLFQQAVSGQWSTEKFTASLQNTKWYKTHGSDERKWLLEAATDPATAKQDMAQATTHATQLMASIGLSAASNGKQWNSLLSSMAYNIVAKGWNDQQVKQFAGQYLKLTNGKMSGDAEAQYSNALQYAYSMGVTMSDSWYQNQVRNIERGLATDADLQAGIRAQAKAQYSQWSKQIDAGQTIQDLASPYMQQMGQILEVNTNALSAFDPTIKKALSYKDPTTGQMGAMPLWQFEQSLRQDPRWLKTQNAQDSIMGVAHSVLKDFGLIGA